MLCTVSQWWHTVSGGVAVLPTAPESPLVYACELWVFAMCPALRGSAVSYAGDAHFPKHSLEYSLNFWSQSIKKVRRDASSQGQWRPDVVMINNDIAPHCTEFKVRGACTGVFEKLLNRVL